MPEKKTIVHCDNPQKGTIFSPILWAACSALADIVTNITANVTCGNCKRTNRFKELVKRGY